MKIDLTDGCIFGIDENSYSFRGCPTCDYGSEYITELIFDVELYKDNKEKKVIVTSNQMYEYNEKMNVGNTIMLMAEIIENKVSFDKFLNKLKTWFGEDCEIKIK